MKPTKKELEKIELCAVYHNKTDKYVYLRKDDKGFYIEYAFKEGAPHDNRCLSWYDSYQENAYIRNGWFNKCTDEEREISLAAIKAKREARVGELFRLSSFTCGHEEYPKLSLEDSEQHWNEFHPNEPFVPENHICKVGCPAPNCRNCQCKGWTYEEPVKCACWYLKEPDVPDYLNIPIEKAIELHKKNLI